MTTIDRPLVFDSYLRPQIWGGDGLHQQLNKPHPPHFKMGEAWELSTLPEHESRVMGGVFGGSSLSETWARSHAEFPGQETFDDEFPWLVKWLDCAASLSLQVHPDDSMARAALGQPQGKSEVWVIVHVEPGACIHAGLRAGVTRKMFEDRLADGSIDECLHSFQPQVGDCLSLPAGTVHTARGVMMAEVQQRSDATFRLFDWDRRDESGQMRLLHQSQGLQAIDWKQGAINPVVPQPLSAQPKGASGEVLLATSWVQLERFVVDRSWAVPYSGEITVWMVLDGNAELIDRAHDQRFQLPRGSTVLIPSAAKDVTWMPTPGGNSCQLLCIQKSSKLNLNLTRIAHGRNAGLRQLV